MVVQMEFSGLQKLTGGSVGVYSSNFQEVLGSLIFQNFPRLSLRHSDISLLAKAYYRTDELPAVGSKIDVENGS